MEWLAPILMAGVTGLFAWLRARDKLRYDDKLGRLEAEHASCRSTLNDFRERLDRIMSYLGLHQE